MAPAEFFKAAWIRLAPEPRVRVLGADGERLCGSTVGNSSMGSSSVGGSSVGSTLLEECAVGMSWLLAGRAA